MDQSQNDIFNNWMLQGVCVVGYIDYIPLLSTGTALFTAWSQNFLRDQ